MTGKINGFEFTQKRTQTGKVVYDLQKKTQKHENLTAKEMHELANKVKE